MNDALIKNISYNNGLEETIAIIGDTTNKLKMKGNYILANKDQILSNSVSKAKKSFLFEDIGIKSNDFTLTIICSILLVIISGIIMYFSWRI